MPPPGRCNHPGGTRGDSRYPVQKHPGTNPPQNVTYAQHMPLKVWQQHRTLPLTGTGDGQVVPDGLLGVVMTTTTKTSMRTERSFMAAPLHFFPSSGTRNRNEISLAIQRESFPRFIASRYAVAEYPKRIENCSRVRSFALRTFSASSRVSMPRT